MSDIFDSKFLQYSIGEYDAAISAHKKANKSSIEKSALIIGGFARQYINNDNILLFCGVLCGQACIIKNRINADKNGSIKSVGRLNNNMGILDHDAETLYIFINKFNQSVSQDKKIDWENVALGMGVRP